MSQIGQGVQQKHKMQVLVHQYLLLIFEKLLAKIYFVRYTNFLLLKIFDKYYSAAYYYLVDFE